jgi:hypothetical protein
MLGKVRLGQVRLGKERSCKVRISYSKKKFIFHLFGTQMLMHNFIFLFVKIFNLSFRVLEDVFECLEMHTSPLKPYHSYR